MQVFCVNKVVEEESIFALAKTPTKKGHPMKLKSLLMLPTRMDMNFLVIGSPMLCLQWVSGPTVIGMEKLV